MRKVQGQETLSRCCGHAFGMRTDFSVASSRPRLGLVHTALVMSLQNNQTNGTTTLEQEFRQGKILGEQLRQRFTQPVIDDPGLPYADCLVTLSTTMAIAYFVLATGNPRPSWLIPQPGVPQIRAIPYILPTIAHGSQLAFCWLLGALAASAFQRDAFCSSLLETISRTLRAGAFASGVLILGTQLVAYDIVGNVELSAAANIKLNSLASEVSVDIISQAIALILFRIFRYYDAVSNK